MKITVFKPNWLIIFGFILGLTMMLVAAVRADVLPLLPAVAPVEVYIATINIEGEATHVLKRDTKRIVKQLNKDGFIDAVAGTQAGLEDDAVVPSFLMFAQWVVDPDNDEGYVGIIVSLVFMDADGGLWLVQNYVLEALLDTPKLIMSARKDVFEIMRQGLALDAGDYWLDFLKARMEYQKKLRQEEGTRDV